MGEVVNLRQTRKRKARAERAKIADENRTRHGLSKAEKVRMEGERQRGRSFLDGHRLDEAKDDGR